MPGLAGSAVETRTPGLSACPDCCWLNPNANGSPIRGSLFRGVSLTESVKRYSSVTRKTPQVAQKGPAARRRPRAAREAYSLYVERAAEGANAAAPRRGALPPFRTSPQDSLRRQSRRSDMEPSRVTGERLSRRTDRSPCSPMGGPLRARALPAHRGGSRNLRGARRRSTAHLRAGADAPDGAALLPLLER